MFQKITGPQPAAAAVLFSQVLDGEEATRVGLSFRCYEDDELLAAAQAMAATTSRVPRSLVLRTKQTLQEIPFVATQNAAVSYELGPQADSARQPAFKAQIQALKDRIASKK